MNYICSVSYCCKMAIGTSGGYGYLFWAGPEGSFRASGKYGQSVILLRDKNAVITVTAECRDSKSLLRAVFEEIYPQL